MVWLFVLFLVGAILLLFRLLMNNSFHIPRGDELLTSVPEAAPTPESGTVTQYWGSRFHASLFGTSCRAARLHDGRVYDPVLSPSLPLTGCDQPVCHCRIETLSERRAGQERRLGIERRYLHRHQSRPDRRGHGERRFSVVDAANLA